MLDALTNFGSIEFTANAGGQTVKSDVIVMIDEDPARDPISSVAGHAVNPPLDGVVHIEKGPYDLRIAIYPKAEPTADVTFSLLEGNALTGDNIASPETVISKGFKKEDFHVGKALKISVPLEHKKYWQLSATSTSAVKVFAGLEFGA